MIQLLVLFHIIGTALGVGGATSSDMLFMRTVRNRRISRDQFVLIQTISRIVLAGLAVVVISGSGLLMDEYVRVGTMALLEQAHFQAKMILVFTLLLNGIVFHSIVFRFLERHLDVTMDDETVASRLWVLAGSGAVSIVSWYGILALAVLGPLPLPLFFLVTLYLTFVVGGTIAAYLVLSHLFFAPVEHTFGRSGVSFERSSVIPLTLLAVLLVGVLAVGMWPEDDDPARVEDADHIVEIHEAPPWFRPDVLRIEAGETVAWIHAHGHDHNGEHVHTHPIQSIEGPEPFTSELRPIGHAEDGNEYRFTFEEEGVYEYVCPTHPYMIGIIAVGVEPGEESLWPPDEEINPELLPPPDVRGIGEIWVNTQFEEVDGQDGPGTITVINAETWEIEEVIQHESFNNPHNLRLSYDGRYIFQTQWHSDVFTKIDAETREVIESKSVGNAPAHTFINPQTDEVIVTLNNEGHVLVMDQDMNVLRRIETSFGPHGVWIDTRGRYMVLAATLDGKLDIVDLETEEVIATFDAPGLPLAAEITHDGRYAMISLLMEHTVRFIDLETMEHVADVQVGEMPIWPRPGPYGRYVYVPNTGTADISVIDLETLEVVVTLPAAGGAHGITFCPNEDGGYYGYFSNKYARVVGVVDADRLETVGYIELGEGQWGGNGIHCMPNNAYDRRIQEQRAQR